MTHAWGPEGACGAQVRNHRCTLGRDHVGRCVMDRDLAVAWWGTKDTHRWGAAELEADRAA